jgi:nitrogen-specific signal transduction histidine kinase
MVSVNQTVEAVIEERSFDLAEEAIRLSASLSDAVPPLTLNMTALRQAVLCCVDAAAVSLRATAGGGTIEIVTALDYANADADADGEDEVLVCVRQDQGGLPRSALRQLGATPLSTRSPASELDSSLGLAREIVSQLHGTLTGHNRPQGGAELWIRLPVRMAAGYPSSSSVAGP